MIIEIKTPNNLAQIFKPLRIEPGKAYDFTISKTKSSTLPKPYSGCNSNRALFSSPVFDEMMKRQIEYDQLLCVSALTQYKIVKQFGCYNAFMTPLFSSSSYEICMNRSIFNESIGITNTLDEVRQMCPIDCDREILDTSIGIQTFPTISWYQAAVHYESSYFESLYGTPRPRYEDVKSNFVMLQVTFSHIAIQEMFEKPSVEWPTLLSNIGGQMGLFIGPSLLTLTEIFELIFVYIAIWYAQKRAMASRMEVVSHVDDDLDKNANKNVELTCISELK